MNHSMFSHIIIYTTRLDVHILTCVFRTTLLLSGDRQTGTCSDLVDVVPMVSERKVYG